MKLSFSSKEMLIREGVMLMAGSRRAYKMATNPGPRIPQIIDIDKLLSLLKVREDLRLLYATMQVAYQASTNPLFQTYMRYIALMGDAINEDISGWFADHVMQHGDIDEDISEPGRQP
jgi:hypothetical protein